MKEFGLLCAIVCIAITSSIFIVGVLILVSDSYQRGLCEMDNNVYGCVKIFVPKVVE
jgi:hypothetical protein